MRKEEFIVKIRKYLEINGIENTMSKLWDASKVVLRRKSVAVMLTLGDITKAHNNELKS